MKRPLHWVMGLLALAILAVFAVQLFQNHFHSRKAESPVAQPTAATIAPIAPAPPQLPLSNRQTARKSATASSAQTASPDFALRYDDNLSFEANLEQLKEFCRSHSGDQRLQQLLDPFLKTLLERAKTQFAVAKRALEELDGSAAYRNILLGCLMSADGSSAEKANIVWQIALDSREPVEVRRTASFLAGQVGDSQKRPDDLFTLLSDSDSQVAVFALQNAASHLDQRNYDLIRTNLLNSSDIHLQVAAVNAIGNAPFADSQATLTSILASVRTSKDEAFSEPSLLKRAAIVRLDMHNPEVLAAVKQIALDDNEDPGVRAKAIGRFTPNEFPNQTDMLVGLLKKLDADNTVSLRAVVDALLAAPTAERIQMIRTRAQELTDPQVGKLLLERIRIATEGRDL